MALDWSPALRLKASPEILDEGKSVEEIREPFEVARAF